MTKYLDLGINTIAINDNKQAIYPWKRFQTEKITAEELERQLSDSRAKGIAIICGAISGGLEVIDIDTKYQTYELWEAIKQRIPQPIYNRLHIVRTKSGGYHLYYRCERIVTGKQIGRAHV